MTSRNKKKCVYHGRGSLPTHSTCGYLKKKLYATLVITFWATSKNVHISRSFQEVFSRWLILTPQEEALRKAALIAVSRLQSCTVSDSEASVSSKNCTVAFCSCLQDIRTHHQQVSGNRSSVTSTMPDSASFTPLQVCENYSLYSKWSNNLSQSIPMALLLKPVDAETYSTLRTEPRH